VCLSTPHSFPSFFLSYSFQELAQQTYFCTAVKLSAQPPIKMAPKEAYKPASNSKSEMNKPKGGAAKDAGVSLPSLLRRCITPHFLPPSPPTERAKNKAKKV
jgi:hypothetical protein